MVLEVLTKNPAPPSGILSPFPGRGEIEGGYLEVLKKIYRIILVLL
jgi:hypothetical protein